MRRLLHRVPVRSLGYARSYQGRNRWERLLQVDRWPVYAWHPVPSRSRVETVQLTVTLSALRGQVLANSRPHVRRRVGLATVWGVGVVLAVQSVKQSVATQTFGADAHAYWLAGHSSQPYSSPPRSLNAFLYSPVFAQLTHPLTWLPWPGFLVTWVILEGAVFFWLLRPLGLAWALPLLLCCTPELVMGNVNAFLALAVVVGMSRPAAWAFPVLTKLTPGIGVLWFAARKEWRPFSYALLSAAILSCASFLLAPHMWLDWVRFLAENRGNGGLGALARVVVAAGAIWLAGTWNRRWVVALALLLATPVVSGLSATLLTAVPRLARLPTSAPKAATVLTEGDGNP